MLDISGAGCLRCTVSRTMATATKNRVLFTCLLAAIVAAPAGIGLKRTRHDPIYQGKRLSVWLVDLDARSAGAQRDGAREAVWALGTNALGPLPNMLRARDHLPQKILANLNGFGATRSPVGFHFTTAVDEHHRALAAYGLLGPIASPDVPLLSRMLLEETRPEVRLQAARALHCIHPVGPDAAPAAASLAAASRDTDSEVRYASTFALVVIRPEASLLVPVLVERLSDPFAPTRDIAKSGLLALGDAAISVLRDACRTNEIASNVLRQIHARKSPHLMEQKGIRYL